MVQERVSPDAVRVWRGFQGSGLTVQDFYRKLGTVFIPATVKMQIDVGLTAYCPTALAGLPDKPASVPDETAILFWRSQDAYRMGFETLAVRAYTLTHGGVYAPGSRADFPVRFTGTLTVDQPVYLVDVPADWMRGEVRHFVGGRRASDTPEVFRDAVATALDEITKDVPLDGAIACVGRDGVVYWELASTASSGAAVLEPVVGWKHEVVAAPTDLAAGLWDTWPGMDVGIGGSFNIQFARKL